MRPYGRLLAPILVAALAGCSSGGAATPTAAKTTDEPTSTDARPTPAPAASGTLAYILDGDVYVADPDGSNAVKIADGRPPEDCGGDVGQYWAEGPMWSPDGRYLAYRYSDCSSSEHIGRDVVISDAEGNVLATFPAQGWDIAWSPDSTGVAVWDRFYDPPSTIGVYGVDGARQTQLTMPSGWTPSGDYDPVWMPDGTSLKVHNVEVPLDGSTPRLGWELPSYSPDGTRVAYVDHNSLVVAAADRSDAREVVGPGVLDPVWSPTGDRIAFIYSEKNVYGPNELRVLDVVTGEVTPLFGMGGSVHIWNIQFSPEGDRILFSMTEDRKGESSLWSIGVDGSDARLVVAGTAQGDWLSR
jgi:Tol biopolymer transport system component